MGKKGVKINERRICRRKALVHCIRKEFERSDIQLELIAPQKFYHV